MDEEEDVLDKRVRVFGVAGAPEEWVAVEKKGVKADVDLAKKVNALLAQRDAAKDKEEYKQADAAANSLKAMAIAYDDTTRTWFVKEATT